ncbi:MAG: beta-lactamase family protein [Bacteroidetes bacterium]|nr:beta-lactamase family protein [Bacteroidota bacterium]
MKFDLQIPVYFLCLMGSVAFSQTKSTDQVDVYLKEMLAKYKIPGAAIAVVKNGKVVKKANYGINSIEFNLPVTDSTIFPLASVTKLFTSTLIMKMSEKGMLSVEDPITKYIDSLPESWRAITIRNLLSHTSGIKNHFQTKKWNIGRDNTNKLSMRQIIQYSAEEPLMFAPGDNYSYSVTGYMLLGMVAEKVSGKPIDLLAKELLYSPLNMTSTLYGDYKAVIRNRNSLVYTFQNGPFETWNFTYGASGTTAAGLNTTTTDMVKFFVALDNGKLLSKQAMTAMMTPTVLNNGSIKNYGLGWVVDENNGVKCYGHEGGGCAWIDYYPSKHLTVIVLSNLTGSKADEIVKRVANFYF